MPDADDFRALARSSPWRWSTLRFSVRWPGNPWRTGPVRAWLRRPDLLRVETLDGDLLQVVREQPRRTSVFGPTRRPVGVGGRRPDDAVLRAALLLLLFAALAGGRRPRAGGRRRRPATGRVPRRPPGAAGRADGGVRARRRSRGPGDRPRPAHRGRRRADGRRAVPLIPTPSRAPALPVSRQVDDQRPWSARPQPQ
ncbi:hypothetical protein DQ238_21345 [Geodermatophilus sp. TF02-6]|nr:hypothetical protein DQ238_21345 [Geodermatophilus sp. TF02-6]